MRASARSKNAQAGWNVVPIERGSQMTRIHVDFADVRDGIERIGLFLFTPVALVMFFYFVLCDFFAPKPY